MITSQTWLRGQDLNLGPSGYEPDELPGCSTPRLGVCACWCGMWHALGVVCGGVVCGLALCARLVCAYGGMRAWRTWRRPTVPRLEPQYHGRWGVSRPSSGWDRVGHLPPWPPGRPSPCGPVRACGPGRDWGAVCCAVLRGVCLVCWRGVCWRCLLVCCCLDLALGACWRWAGVWASVRAIRTARLSALLRLHLRPIDVVVYHGPRGDLVWREVSRLDAFSGYPVRTWLPGCAAGATTGPPVVRPPRSSRTRGSASQVSVTHGR
jgi:hypothetical protein